MPVAGSDAGGAPPGWSVDAPVSDAARDGLRPAGDPTRGSRSGRARTIRGRRKQRPALQRDAAWEIHAGGERSGMIRSQLRRQFDLRHRAQANGRGFELSSGKLGCGEPRLRGFPSRPGRA